MNPRGSTDAPWLRPLPEHEGPPAFTIYALHEPTPDRLAKVRAQMLELGAPEIEVVYFHGHIMALEGSHRLAAASELGLVPRFAVHSPHDMLDLPRYDWFDPGFWEEWRLPADFMVRDLFFVGQAVAYRFSGYPQMRLAEGAES
ncbi:hypothetical protein QO010_000696 [Caulobacter ginsengisoli]|uniref:ParB/Sulfiredoxin domain-containing protein n=1 Tax=Caulobacter ginsengisoli TaxID=400775 RepID=A0ABU0ILQ6_9CAUL|nr:hypothetical protein [Caulobacter ginsengisoli]MDQ0462948.1 hypothetical protein [Caulobacter ginsengisoli]